MKTIKELNDYSERTRRAIRINRKPKNKGFVFYGFWGCRE